MSSEQKGIHNPGNWSVGKNGHCVVSDAQGGGIPGSDEVQSYGGYLIAESVGRSNIPIIAAAPKMLKALVFLRDAMRGFDISMASEIKAIDEAIAAATTPIVPPECSQVAGKPAVEDPDEWVMQDRVAIRNGVDFGYWNLDGNEPPDFSPVYDSEWWIMDGRPDAAGLRHGDTDHDFTLYVRCRRKDLPPMADPVPAPPEKEFPSNQQLFEMVANLRDQMDSLSRRCGAVPDSQVKPEQESPCDTNHVKPPLGIKPERLWFESRRDDIYAAISRYRDAGYVVPVQWLDELCDIEVVLQAE